MTGIRDPITFELFKNAVLSIADEMALTLTRTTYSGVLRDNMDFSTAFCDGAGRLVAQGLTIPGHLGSIPTALAAVIAKYGDDMAEGDLFCLNDPFAGGMHLPDVFVFKPIFHEGRRLAFAATICHHADVGGRVAGSNAADSTEIFQEGLRIPPSRLYRRGERNETLFDLVERNVRVPIQVLGDLRAQLSACHVAESQFADLVRRYGADGVAALMDELIDYAERMTRAALAELPDGEFAFEDWIDDDGVDEGRPIRLYVTVRKQDERITFDWTGCAAQVRGAINNTLSYTSAVSYAAIRSILKGDIPANEGLFRCVEVIAPEGTIANMKLPGACAARGLTGFRMMDCAFGALAMMAPDRVFAASDGGNTGISVGGWRADGTPFIYVDFTCGTWGGRPWADGLEGNSNVFANMASQSIEVTEADHPLEILAYEYVADQAGPGRFRGGAPYRRDYRFNEARGTLQVRADRQRFLPYGLYGGYPGRPSLNVLDPEGRADPMPSKFTREIERGTVVRHQLAGAGGWGDPLDREPEKVLKDVRNELVSVEGARRDYGVVVREGPLRLDLPATAALRASLRDRRGWSETPAVLREEPS